MDLSNFNEYIYSAYIRFCDNKPTSIALLDEFTICYDSVKYDINNRINVLNILHKNIPNIKKRISKKKKQLLFVSLFSILYTSIFLLVNIMSLALIITFSLLSVIILPMCFFLLTSLISQINELKNTIKNIDNGLLPGENKQMIFDLIRSYNYNNSINNNIGKSLKHNKIIPIDDIYNSFHINKNTSDTKQNCKIYTLKK